MMNGNKMSAFEYYNNLNTKQMSQTKKKTKKIKKLFSQALSTPLPAVSTSEDEDTKSLKKTTQLQPTKITKKNKVLNNWSSSENLNNAKGKKHLSSSSELPDKSSGIIRKLVNDQKMNMLSLKSGDEQKAAKSKKRKCSKVDNSNSDVSIVEDNNKIEPSKKKSKIELKPKEEVEIYTEGVNVESENSVKMGEDVFKWIINPIPADDFFRESWEKKPVLIERLACENYYRSLLNTEMIDGILRKNVLHFSRNVDVTTYTNGIRETLNPVGRAFPAMVWDYYSNGCSIRLLNPQSYSRKLHQIIAYLQEFFGSFVGANAYLTPADSQGFAPHFDDIEAFILQIEGKKHWKLYSPRPEEKLPRYSSANLKEEDLPPPIMEVTLKAGDLLYFPRGFIHQGRTEPDAHSLHLTISFYQKTSWADFLEKLLPATLKLAIESDSDFRRGLPLHFSEYLGVANANPNNAVQSAKRMAFKSSLEKLLTKMLVKSPIDATIDEMAKEFQHAAMPPVLKTHEKKLSVYDDGERIGNNGQVINSVEIDPDVKVKLLRKHILRLIMEEDSIRVYHYAYNAKEYHAEEPQYFEIDPIIAPAVEMLIQRYPRFVKVADLPIPDLSSRIQIVSDLWERGLILTDQPLAAST